MMEEILIQNSESLVSNNTNEIVEVVDNKVVIEEIEVWKDIVGYEGYYQISSFGQIRSLDRIIRKMGTSTGSCKGRILNLYIRKNGYLNVKITKHHKITCILVHTAVAKHFIENPNNYWIVKHKDGVLTNNNYKNLEWSRGNQHKSWKEKTHFCKQCKQTKPKELFGISSHSGKYASPCKQCIKDKNKIYSKKHSKRILAYANKWRKEEKKKNPLFKLACLLRDRVRHAIKHNITPTKKIRRTLELIGCSIEECRKHIESQFLPGMSWENHGKYTWHVDHIVPVSSFDLSDPKQQEACFHYTNLQPLWCQDNNNKNDLLPNGERASLKLRLKKELKENMDKIAQEENL